MQEEIEIHVAQRKQPRRLSVNQEKLLSSLSAGLTMKDTAFAMGIRYGTAKQYLALVRRKFGGTTVGLVVRYVKGELPSRMRTETIQ